MKKEESFIKKPDYPGGRKALRDFISAHLQYPKDAMEQGVEGTVTVAYEVNDEGIVVSTKIIKGLIPSCNEEALRLVQMLQYGKVFNHGIRIKTNHKISIHFKLAPIPVANTQVTYTLTKSSQKVEKKKKSNYVNSYTITFS